MSNNLIFEVSYARPETLNRLIGELERFIYEGGSREFMDFEVDLSRMKTERDSFSDEERKAISESFGEGILKVVSSGNYLDALERIVIEVNSCLAKGRGKMESGYSGMVYDEDIGWSESDLWGYAIEGCQYSYQDFVNSIFCEVYT